ncbi:MAG: Asp-tRNA(Asn)/Glu-tRNA(Gln) amidotransferase subunit GatC [Gemmataceae bacterium]
MAITPNEVRWIARELARLDLSDAEVDSLARDLTKIVGYVDQLQEANTNGVEPLAHPLELSNIFRPDVAHPSLPVNDALANAPVRKGDFYAVPEVFE